MPPAANEAPPVPIAKIETPVAKVEAPTSSVPVEAPKVEVQEADSLHVAAERQKTEAEVSMKEDLEALQAFAGEHSLHLDTDFNVPKTELDTLTSTERDYVAVLQAKYRAGHASQAHAEALLAVANENDPDKKKELSKKAFDLYTTSAALEKGATMLNAQYMALPEIAAMGVGNATGGSIGGQAFENTPGAAGPTGPQGPEGPDGLHPPNLELIQGGPRSSPPSGGPLYNDEVSGGPPGIANIAPIKSEGGGNPDKPKPSGIDRWVRKQFGALAGFFGGGGGDTQDRH